MMKKRLFFLLSLTILGLMAVSFGCKSKDNAPPQITLLGDNPMTINIGSIFTDPGATAIDERDGDLTSEIVVTGGVDANLCGNFVINYSVMDEAGNSAGLSRTGQVVLYRDFTLGNYSTTNTCTSSPSNTVASNSAFQTSASGDKFVISPFYFNGGTLTCTLSGTYGRSVTVDTGQAPNPAGYGITGSGTFTPNGKVLTMNYTFTPSGGAAQSCSVTYTKP